MRDRLSAVCITSTGGKASSALLAARSLQQDRLGQVLSCNSSVDLSNDHQRQRWIVVACVVRVSELALLLPGTPRLAPPAILLPRVQRRCARSWEERSRQQHSRQRVATSTSTQAPPAERHASYLASLVVRPLVRLRVLTGSIVPTSGEGRDDNKTNLNTCNAYISICR